jgi:hypothetical protein
MHSRCAKSLELTPFRGFGCRFCGYRQQRWLHQDTIVESGGINLYRYVGNDPVNSVDPFGDAIGWDCVACAAALTGKLWGIVAGCTSGCGGVKPFGQCVSDCVKSSLRFDAGNPAEWAGYLACLSCDWRGVFKASKDPDPVPCPPIKPTQPPPVRPPPIGPRPGRGPVGPPPPNNGPGTPPWSNN